ncbi:hypothetical protein CTI12_AA137100 [Artemisia annua]|uniref:Uncharacterized protein n=1 Tax=Artemisia annua TaxID=35608 RepID=A0A2U1PM52_ARTAN|nr:hypothetical protein CTI12_AA137100 [Artemisia annua]
MGDYDIDLMGNLRTIIAGDTRMTHHVHPSPRSNGGNTIYTFTDFHDFLAAKSTPLGYSGNYKHLARDLDSGIYVVDYEKFQNAVETLIGGISGGANPRERHKWRQSIFRVIMGVAEGCETEPYPHPFIIHKLVGDQVEHQDNGWNCYSKTGL